MSTRMRLAFAGIAVAILVLAIVILAGNSSNSNDEKPASQATPAATGTATAGETATEAPTETPTETPTASPTPLLTTANVTKIEVNKGDTVSFQARSKVDDEIHVHGYDFKKDAPAGQTVSMSFKATIDGIFVIEFESQGTQIGSLRVNP